MLVFTQLKGVPTLVALPEAAEQRMMMLPPAQKAPPPG